MLALTSKHRISLSNNNQTNPKKEKSLRYGLCLENKAAEEEEKEWESREEFIRATIRHSHLFLCVCDSLKLNSDYVLYIHKSWVPINGSHCFNNAWINGVCITS